MTLWPNAIRPCTISSVQLRKMALTMAPLTCGLRKDTTRIRLRSTSLSTNGTLTAVVSPSSWNWVWLTTTRPTAKSNRASSLRLKSSTLTKSSWHSPRLKRVGTGKLSGMALPFRLTLPPISGPSVSPRAGLCACTRTVPAWIPCSRIPCSTPWAVLVS